LEIYAGVEHGTKVVMVTVSVFVVVITSVVTGADVVETVPLLAFDVVHGWRADVVVDLVTADVVAELSWAEVVHLEVELLLAVEEVHG